MKRQLYALFLVLALACVPATGAQGAVGDLSWAQCIANAGNLGCEDPPIDSFRGAAGVAVSPDGGAVYVAGADDSTVSSLAVGTTGALTFAGCTSDLDALGCEDPGQDSLSSAERVAASPDGRNVYVTSAAADSISHFIARPDRTLAYAGCIADEGKNACTNPALDALDHPRDLAVSPDGSSVYVAARVDSAINQFRVLPGGGLEFVGCIAEGGQNGCIDPAQDALEGANSVEVSADGTSVYAGSEDEAINHFERAPDGSLVFRGCIGDGGAGGQCTASPKESLGGSLSLDVSADGANLYVGSAGADAVTTYRVGAEGALEYMDCIADDGTAGCVDPPLDPLDDVVDVAVSPDGLSVYAAGIDENSLSHFGRGPGGALAFAGCVADAGLNGCADPPVDSLDAPYSVAVSPDGKSVYVGGYSASAITRFAREVPDTTPPETTFAKKPKRKLKTKRKRAKAKFKLAASEPGSTFECRLDKKDFAPCKPSLKLKAKRGKHTFQARAVDAAGNVDQTPARAKFKVKRKPKRA